ncbi:MAG: peptidase M20 [Alphaproteobacteria bacterium RIFCSPHIGHO2_12_FULL_63_12]|nr:MAG: peptidase M20 [Alphaproteobacteria bacterium RIFCSPHIGHO2_12_FULL_63_12]
MLAHAALKSFVEKTWREEVTPTLVDYIRIPNKSPAFEPEWEKLGHMEKAVAMFESWARGKLKELPGATLSVMRAPGRTPLIVIDAPGAVKGETILLYGHLDKQPEMTGWASGKGPWLPVIEDDKLYGRGGADDGYALFGALTALVALEKQGVARARCVTIIEASEESGSPDLPYYMEQLAPKIGDVGLVVCLDSGCGDYERLWLTTSLRGLIGGTLRVDVLEEGVHSGDASGIVPSSFRILRMLLDRVDDVATGAVKAAAFQTTIPEDRRAQAKIAAAALGDAVFSKFPFVRGMSPATGDRAELILNRTWRSALSVTGLAGAPAPENAGNVLRPSTTAKLSLRLPPTLDADAASAALKRLLEENPPYGARVAFAPEPAGGGWNAPVTAPWLEAALDAASLASWGKPSAMMGEGGTIPFMGMLGRVFPKAQFAITGVLGPNSNAHGPNEFLHLPTGMRVTETVAQVVAAHGAK